MMKIALLIIFISSALVYGRDGYGYALFGLGGQNANYNESFTSENGETISMRGTVQSPYYYTGTGVRFNEKIDFSLSGSSTLYANSTDEAKFILPHQTIDHSMDLRNNELMLYLHYKYTPHHHFLTGMGYSSETIKRFLFQHSLLNSHAILETNTISGNLEIGYLYQKNARIGHEDWSYAFGVMIGTPLFTSVTQIYSEKLDESKQNINGTFGVSVHPSLYVAHKVFEGFDLALSLSYYYRLRIENTSITYNEINYAADNSILKRYRTGLFAIWNFD